MAKEPTALQLRYLQTLAEIATENNSTTIFPVPVDFLKVFMDAMGKRTASGRTCGARGRAPAPGGDACTCW